MTVFSDQSVDTLIETIDPNNGFTKKLTLGGLIYMTMDEIWNTIRSHKSSDIGGAVDKIEQVFQSPTLKKIDELADSIEEQLNYPEDDRRRAEELLNKLHQEVPHNIDLSKLALSLEMTNCTTSN